MSDDDIKRLREVAQAATPGPWGAYYDLGVYANGGALVAVAKTGVTRGGFSHDTAYIAAVSPDVVTRLIDRLEAAERERDELRDECSELIDALDDMVYQHCGTSEGEFDSRALSANARAMRLLAQAGLISVTADVGRRVIATRVDDDAARAAKEQSK